MLSLKAVAWRRRIAGRGYIVVRCLRVFLQAMSQSHASHHLQALPEGPPKKKAKAWVSLLDEELAGGLGRGGVGMDSSSPVPPQPSIHVGRVDEKPERQAPSQLKDFGPEGEGPLGWTARLRSAFAPTFEKLGKQVAKLMVTTACSGTGCPLLALQARKRA